MGYPPQGDGGVKETVDTIETDVNTIDGKVDVIDGKTDTLLDDVNELLVLSSHIHLIFPTATNLTVTFESPDGAANTWSAWTEIADNVATTLSSMFGTQGHIEEVFVETATAAVVYMMEVSFGAARSVIFRKRFASSGAGAVQTIDQGGAMTGAEIPAGETIYYRLMAAGAGDDCTVNIHYMLHD